MKTTGIFALAAIAALVLGFGARLGTQTAHADVDATVVVSCEFLIGAIDGDTEDLATPAGADGLAACDGISAADVDALAGDLDADGTPGETTPLENGLGDNDGTLEASDFDDIDLDANQVTDEGAGVADNTYIFAFVDDDAGVSFDAQAGGTILVNEDGGVDEAAPAADADVETCTGGDDEDCGTSVTTNGDGVVVATFEETTDADGDTNDVVVTQESVSSTETINIEGAADEVDAIAVETTIGTSDDADACTEDLDVDDAVDQLADLEKTVIIATVTDNDGDELTRVSVVFTADGAVLVDETESAEPGSEPSFDSSISVDAGDAGIAAFAVVCGDEDPGDGTVTATINSGTTGEEDSVVDIAVVGPPANVALTASPAAIDCDGTATSTVSATVTDADGNNVPNGTSVNFSVVALGTASPINADTTDGVATSTITPLSGAVAGVTVIVTAGDAQSSIRVDCNTPAAATATPGGAPTPPGGIGGPDTGNGGYVGQDSAGFPMWTLVALALGSLTLVAGGLVTRRAGR